MNKAQYRAARMKIENPENWTTHTYARYDQRSPPVSPASGEAHCFCGLGACISVAGRLRSPGHSLDGDDTFPELYQAALQVIRQRQKRIPPETNPVVFVNDRLADHSAVLQMFDLAIEYAKD